MKLDGVLVLSGKVLILHYLLELLLTTFIRNKIYLVELVDVLVACKPPGPVLYMRVGKDVPPSSTEPRMFEPRSG